MLGGYQGETDWIPGTALFSKPVVMFVPLIQPFSHQLTTEPYFVSTLSPNMLGGYRQKPAFVKLELMISRPNLTSNPQL